MKLNERKKKKNVKRKKLVSRLFFSFEIKKNIEIYILEDKSKKPADEEESDAEEPDSPHAGDEL